MKKKTITAALSIIAVLFIFLTAVHAGDYSSGITGQGPIGLTADQSEIILLAAARYEADSNERINHYLKAGSDDAADDLNDMKDNKESYLEIEDIGHIVLSQYIIDPLDSWTNKSSLTTAGKKLISGTINLSIPVLAEGAVGSALGNGHFSGDQAATGIAGAFVGAMLTNLSGDKLEINTEARQGGAMVSLSFRF